MDKKIPRPDKTRRGMSLFVDSEQGPCHPFIQQHGQKGDRSTLHQIQRRYTQRHKGEHTGDAGVDCGAHADEYLHGDAVELGELGQ